MQKRYTIAITHNPDAGDNMVSILIIDTMPEDGKSEVYSATVPHGEKHTSLSEYLERIGQESHIIDLT